MQSNKVSQRLLKRLPVYLRHIKSLPENEKYISSTKLAKCLGLGDVMVRKDLAKVSDGGRPKLGYARDRLIEDIENYLDLNSTTDAIVVGAGKLGQALLDYVGFEATGLNIVAGFDVSASQRYTKCGKHIYPMKDLTKFCKSNSIAIGIITVPAESAQSVCDELVARGIRAIWNFAPVHLNVPKHIVIQSENLAVSLTTLRMRLKNQHTCNEI